MDGRKERKMDGWTDRWKEGQMDNHTLACTHAWKEGKEGMTDACTHAWKEGRTDRQTHTHERTHARTDARTHGWTDERTNEK